MNNTDSTTSNTITSKELPAILIGGPPEAGKSVLTYNLTQELRLHNIPHYVFRASADIEGDWFLQADVETLNQIVGKVKEFRCWTDVFRAFVCRDLAKRHLPLIVDIGGLPKEADNCIFQVCQYSILLRKDGEEAVTQAWRDYTKHTQRLAELRSQKEGKSLLLTRDPIITGTIAGLKPKTYIHDSVFKALFEKVRQVFSSYSLDQLETFHMDTAPVPFKVNLPDRLLALAPDIGKNGEWVTDLLQPLLDELPAQTAMAVYGRAPIWVYSALALHAATQPFYQFDARLGWIALPIVQAAQGTQSSRDVIHIKEEYPNDAYVILIHPVHNYLDYRDADQLLFPEPPQRGVIVTGKLPEWLFTALARFYAQRDVPWIAVNNARNNQPVVIYSRDRSHRVGQMLPALG